MPSRRAHRYQSLLYFRNEFDKLHEALDRPSKYLGPSHRKLFHTYDQAAMIASSLYPGDSRAIQAAFWHVDLDALCSRDPVFASYVELQAKLNTRRRRRARMIR